MTLPNGLHMIHEVQCWKLCTSLAFNPGVSLQNGNIKDLPWWVFRISKHSIRDSFYVPTHGNEPWLLNSVINCLQYCTSSCVRQNLVSLRQLLGYIMLLFVFSYLDFFNLLLIIVFPVIAHVQIDFGSSPVPSSFPPLIVFYGSALFSIFAFRGTFRTVSHFDSFVRKYGI